MRKTFLFPAVALCATVILTGLSKPSDETLRKEAAEVIKAHPVEGEGIRKKPSLESLKDYKTRAIKLQKRLDRIKSKEVRTTVTFTEPLQASEVVEFIGKHSVEPDLIYLYGKEKDQEGYVTTGVFIDEDDSKERVGELLIEAAGELEQNNAELVGTLAVIGVVPHEEVVPTQNDPKVFLADISADRGFGDNQAGKDYVQHLGYDLYELKQRK